MIEKTIFLSNRNCSETKILFFCSQFHIGDYAAMKHRHAKDHTLWYNDVVTDPNQAWNDCVVSRFRFVARCAWVKNFD
jgi:hypothetical protein